MKNMLASLKGHIERRSLATRLALSMLLVAALTVVAQFFDLNRQNRSEIETLQTNTLINDAQTLADRLDSLVRSDLSRVVNLSLSRAAQEFISVPPNQRATLFTPTLADFTNFLASNEFYQAVLLLDQNGEVVISSNGSYVGQNFGSSDFFQRAFNGNPYMSDPVISSRDRQPVMWLAAPVFAPESSLPVGVVAVSVSPEEVWNAVESYKIGQNGYAILVDLYGIRLAHGRDRNYIFRSLVPLSPEIGTQLKTDGRFGPLTAISDTGSQILWQYLQTNPRPAVVVARLEDQPDRVYYSAASLTSRDWTVVAMLPEAEVLAPATRVTLRGQLASLALILFLAITVVWMAKRIVRPVPQLVRAAGKIAQGDLSTPLQVQAGSELGELAENFEVMRQRLQTSREELATWARELERRVAHRSQELAALSEVVSFASRSQSRSELLETALNLSLRVMNADMGGIWLVDDDGIALRLCAQYGFDWELSQELTSFAPGEGLLGRVQASGAPIALDDISQAPLLARAVVRERALHAFAAVPLRIHGRTLGVLGVFRRAPRPFSPEVISLAGSIAQQIALTVDNMNLVAQVQQQARNVARLQERDRIAADIHDSMAQTQGYIYLQVDTLAETAETTPRPEIRNRLLALRDIMANLSQETRQFIAQLRDVPPPPTRLDETVRSEIERLKPEVTARVDLNLHQAGDMVIPEAISTELARIVGEAVRNAQRHGRARTVQIEFLRRNDNACLCIRDDGSGFDPRLLPNDGRHHFGLSVMQARAARIGGSLIIESTPGAGAKVQVTWPLNKEGG